jgi:hypothetical protein
MYRLTEKGKALIKVLEEDFVEHPTSKRYPHRERRLLLRALYSIEDTGNIPSEEIYEGLLDALLRTGYVKYEDDL